MGHSSRHDQRMRIQATRDRSQASIVSPASFSNIIHASFQELFSISWAKQSESMAKQVLVVAVVPPVAVDADEGAGKSMPGEDAGKSELDEELAEDVLQPNLLSLAHRLKILSPGQVPANHKLSVGFHLSNCWVPSRRNCILPPPKAKDPAQPHPAVYLQRLHSHPYRSPRQPTQHGLINPQCRQCPRWHQRLTPIPCCQLEAWVQRSHIFSQVSYSL